MNSTTPAPPRGRLRRRLIGCFIAFFLLAAIGYGALYLAARQRMSQEFQVSVAALKIPDGDTGAIARGRYLATAVMLCVGCHGDDLGGNAVMDNPVMGRVVAPNLTSGEGGIAAGGGYAIEDWVRAIRFGVGKHGRGLVLMPSSDYWGFGDDDTRALIAFLRALPPVDRKTPETSLGPIGLLTIVNGELRIEAEALHTKGAPPKRPYGEVLSGVCAGCHNPDFSGGRHNGPPDWPNSLNITPDKKAGIGAWTLDDFFKAMREGKTPDGRALHPAAMPWEGFGKMHDADLTQLWEHLQTRTPVSNEN